MKRPYSQQALDEFRALLYTREQIIRAVDMVAAALEEQVKEPDWLSAFAKIAGVDADNTFEFNRLSVDDARKETRLWNTARLALPGLTDEQIAVVVSLVMDTCPTCGENNRECRCWENE